MVHIDYNSTVSADTDSQDYMLDHLFGKRTKPTILTQECWYDAYKPISQTMSSSKEKKKKKT